MPQMTQKWLAFDIETAKTVAGDDFDWKPHRPLGITCIASQSTAEDVPRIWCSRRKSGEPAPQMTQSDVAEFVAWLATSQAEGFLPLSWNGLSFDFDILAEESALFDDCRRLALTHVDMMFHVVCAKGFPVALKNAAAGLGVEGKLDGVEGIDAPALWADGQYDLVTEYVAQDVRATLAVALEATRRGTFKWKTRKGSISTMPLPKGWLTVEEAGRLPLPDTSWMSDPPSRNSFLSWTEEA